jgi:hypothetical protein
MPDFQTSVALGGETYGMAFPTSTFNAVSMPKFTATGTLSNLAPGALIQTSSIAVLFGLTISSPASPFDAWPSSIVGTTGFSIVDSDSDGKPGITASAKTGLLPGGTGSYKDPIYDVSTPSNPLRADRLYLAIRQISSQSGTLTSCTTMSGTSTSSIDTHLVGCRGDTGVDCLDASLLDSIRPVYSVQNADFSAKKLAAGTTCTDVRTAVP